MIYLNKNITRSSAIFAKQISHNLKLPISLFSVDDVYNLVNQECLILIDKQNLENQHLNNLLNDIKVSGHEPLCKILLIGCTSRLEIKNIISIPDDDFVCFDELYNHTENTQKDMVFIELSNSTKEQIEKLNKILYPNNKKIAVKAVNNPGLAHVQNLGLSTENDTLKLLSECSYYVNINSLYLYDAVYANKKIIHVDDIPKIKTIDDIDFIVIDNSIYSNDISDKSISKILNKIL